MNPFKLSTYITLIFLISPGFIGAQQQTAFKPSVKVYPSTHFMYGLMFYKLQTGAKNESVNVYNQNYNIGAYANADLLLQKDFALQFYAGYNRWNEANLFPVGLMIKPKINRRENELYFKLGGGYTFGKRYQDKNESSIFSKKPADYGNGNVHLQAGLEKKWHLSKNRALMAGVMLNIQLIKSYYMPYSMNSTGSLESYFIPYKFAGVTLAYQFY